MSGVRRGLEGGAEEEAAEQAGARVQHGEGTGPAAVTAVACTSCTPGQQG